jgi:hypothetical protein
MKKILIISFSLLVSFVAGLSINNNVFLTDSKNLIIILLTIIGLCFSGFSFVSSSISRIIKSSKAQNVQLKDSSNKLIYSIEKDILLILYLTIVLVIVNLILYIDIPLIINPKDINFGLFHIFSVKEFLVNFIFSFSFCLSFYAFYDLIKATFKLLKKCYE